MRRSALARLPPRHSSAIRVKPQTAAALYTPVASTSIDSKGKGQTSITASIAASVSSEANEDHADARAAPLPALSDYRANLNDMQLRAVTHDLVPLQILAGPGSGKTRVLTCRVAHLLRHYRLPPDRIVVVTFTNKAAREMRDRLTRLVGKAVTDKLVMGTFHSVAVRFLRRFGQRIGLAKDFSIADEDDCMRYIRASLKLHTKDVDRHSMSANLKPGTVRSLISKAKTRCLDAERYEAEVRAKKPLQEDLLLVARVFADYETKLQEVGALDFDDLLNFCLHLFLRYPAVTEGIRHTLVDEFQDTNTVQYQLVKHMARKARVLTIVGDPDQSIYGWRAAEIKNLRLMQGDFESTAKIFLEQNYRSTSAILASAMAVISQGASDGSRPIWADTRLLLADTAREPKHLYTDRDAGPSNVYTRLPDANAEAEYIVKEIRKLVAWTGGLLDYDDFAILLRMNSLSRQLEMELKAQRVPYRMVGGPKFFDRQEVKDILAYLLLANNANNASAFSRVINTPSRGIGLKSAQWIEEHASARKISPFELTRLAVTKSVKLGKSFVELIQDLELLAAEGTSVADLIDAIVDKTRYLDYLEKQHGQKDAKAGVKSEDVENRKANIEELKAFAATFKAPEGDQGLTGVHEEIRTRTIKRERSRCQW
ncbi:uncharacterized protein L969DRAFT_412485 [Mixia osmundae IAM 14324]|uniref:uncharacterized protein n=1 Tax=Mixia osmundae (strain CBS 9802 / IAM 14324 / JCM 22182 / KY 12970) TaxID=764103 RepID=UPI0004A54ED5|nr:uncharacterized protein L969DRAFT_412485 [Mixia osmundae IAM 14324]KEI40279.1 hypothetical protein L969DRAFT_412485 [Mixia osmundae IAM 14324]